MEWTKLIALQLTNNDPPEKLHIIRSCCIFPFLCKGYDILLNTRQLFMSRDWDNLLVWSVQHKHAHFWKDSYPTLNKEGHISTAYSLIL